MRPIRLAALLLTLPCLAAPGSALAQATGAANPPAQPAGEATQPAQPTGEATQPAQPTGDATQPAQPQVTTAVYGDWTLRCVGAGVPAGAPAGTPAQPKHCELDQAIGVQGKPPLAQIAVGADPGDGKMRMVAELPAGVWLPSQPALKMSSKAAPIAMSYKRCIGAACLADTPLTDQLRTSMQAAKTSATVTFQMIAGKDAVIPVSFTGFTPAYAALVRAAAQK
jgi:invasion protein IalB